ncbi:hypothetical protein Goari_002150, partial [Gossypium aridum]|nr:hypothetical protein [Gossypium aridum]
VVEIVKRYDIGCVHKPFRINKVLYIQDDSIPKNCSLSFKVPKYMKAPIDIYYQLDNHYQNHRWCGFTLHRSKHFPGTSKAEVISNYYVDLSIMTPLHVILEELKVNRKNIAWKSDWEHKFGKNVYPFNFQNGTVIGGGKLKPRIPLSDQEDLIVWMHTSALPSFQKFYGRIETDLDVDDVEVVHLMNNYNTFSFGGKKKL